MHMINFSFNLWVIWSMKCQEIVNNFHFKSPKLRVDSPNPKIFSLLSSKTEKSSKDSHLSIWNKWIFVVFAWKMIASVNWLISSKSDAFSYVKILLHLALDPVSSFLVSQVISSNCDLLCLSQLCKWVMLILFSLYLCSPTFWWELTPVGSVFFLFVEFMWWRTCADALSQSSSG